MRPAPRTFAAGLALALLGPGAGLLAAGAAEGVRVTIAQRNRDFSESQVVIRRGEVIRFTNDDEFLHQVFAHGPQFSFDSDEQKPGQAVDVAFPVAGLHQVRCGIHPRMRLRVKVE